MQVVTLFNLTYVLLHSLNTMSETIFSNSLIFQEFSKLKYTLNLKISKSQKLTNAKISRPNVCNHFCEISKFGDFMNTLRNFTKSMFAHISAKFKYFAKQFILTETLDHVV